MSARSAGLLDAAHRPVLGERGVQRVEQRGLGVPPDGHDLFRRLTLTGRRHSAGRVEAQQRAEGREPDSRRALAVARRGLAVPVRHRVLERHPVAQRGEEADHHRNVEVDRVEEARRGGRYYVVLGHHRSVRALWSILTRVDALAARPAGEGWPAARRRFVGPARLLDGRVARHRRGRGGHPPATARRRTPCSRRALCASRSSGSPCRSRAATIWSR
jgi:hypothetical protein